MKKILYYGKIISYNEYLNSIQWKKLRHTAKLKYGFKCEHCDFQKLEVHHNKYPIDFKNDNINNLIVCCSRCHKLHHNIRNKKQKILNDFIRIKNKTLFEYGERYD